MNSRFFIWLTIFPALLIELVCNFFLFSRLFWLGRYLCCCSRRRRCQILSIVIRSPCTCLIEQSDSRVSQLLGHFTCDYLVNSQLVLGLIMCTCVTVRSLFVFRPLLMERVALYRLRQDSSSVISLSLYPFPLVNNQSLLVLIYWHLFLLILLSNEKIWIEDQDKLCLNRQLFWY